MIEYLIPILLFVLLGATIKGLILRIKDKFNH